MSLPEVIPKTGIITDTQMKLLCKGLDSKGYGIFQGVVVLSPLGLLYPIKNKVTLCEGLVVKRLNSSVLDALHKPRKFGIFPEFCGNKT